MVKFNDKAARRKLRKLLAKRSTANKRTPSAEPFASMTAASVVDLHAKEFSLTQESKPSVQLDEPTPINPIDADESSDDEPDNRGKIKPSMIAVEAVRVLMLDGISRTDEEMHVECNARGYDRSSTSVLHGRQWLCHVGTIKYTGRRKENSRGKRVKTFVSVVTGDPGSNNIFDKLTRKSSKEKEDDVTKSTSTPFKLWRVAVARLVATARLSGIHVDPCVSDLIGWLNLNSAK